MPDISRIYLPKPRYAIPLIEESFGSDSSGMMSNELTFEFNQEDIDKPRTKDGKTVLLSKREGSMVKLPHVVGTSLDRRPDGSPLEMTLTAAQAKVFVQN
jgi:hypothetical protein